MEAYFKLESISRKSDLTFHLLRTRLVAAVNARIQNGEYTERGLAKILGVSQPQLHNVLKGARKLQWELADRILKDLDIQFSDLFTGEECASGQEPSSRVAQQPPYSHHEANRESIPRRQPAQELRLLRLRRTSRSTAV